MAGAVEVDLKDPLASSMHSLSESSQSKSSILYANTTCEVKGWHSDSYGVV